VVVQLNDATRVADTDIEWHPPAAFAALALPTAVRRVLDQSLRVAAGAGNG
jgi:hypothetical protein